MYVLLSNTIPMLITVISHHSNNITSKCTVGTEVVCVCDLLGQREGKGREREGKGKGENVVKNRLLFVVWCCLLSSSSSSCCCCCCCSSCCLLVIPPPPHSKATLCWTEAELAKPLALCRTPVWMLFKKKVRPGTLRGKWDVESRFSHAMVLLKNRRYPGLQKVGDNRASLPICWPSTRDQLRTQPIWTPSNVFWLGTWWRKITSIKFLQGHWRPRARKTFKTSSAFFSVKLTGPLLSKTPNRS